MAIYLLVEQWLVSEIQALDTSLQANAGMEFTLHHHKGTFVRPDDFEPLTTVLGPNQSQRFAPPGGRPLGAVFPYFNLEWAGEGRIIVVGWPSQWAAQFKRDSGVGLTVTAGQELTHLKLRPGESIRTPLMVLRFWRGDSVGAQNIWQRSEEVSGRELIEKGLVIEITSPPGAAVVLYKAINAVALIPCVVGQVRVAEALAADLVAAMK